MTLKFCEGTKKQMKRPRLLSSDKREIVAETLLFVVIALVSAWPMLVAIDAILHVG